MRPLHLTMTAFGSSAAKTEIPFDALRRGLFLVTGDTGAGKTTIFDAIMFALYGVASGSDRKGDMLHCDHVDKSTDTAVSLLFSQNGRKITVSRRIHFRKKQGAKNEYNPGTVSALLEEEGRAPTEGAARVTARCEEILGLNAEQFRKIIMLAQGEFREFLRADSEKKNEILGKLFDNSAYVFYQKLLTGARDELKKRREADFARLDYEMKSVFRMPEGLEAEERTAFLPGHPALIQNLESLAESEAARLGELTKEREEADRALADLHARMGAAETVNGLFAELAEEEKTLVSLLAADPEFESRRASFRRTESAFRKAGPAAERSRLADEKLNAASDEIERLRGELDILEQTKAAAEEQVEKDAETAALLDEVKARISALTAEMPRYAELDRAEAEKRDAESASSRIREALEERRIALDRLKTEIETLTAWLNDTADADTSAQAAQFALDRAREEQRAAEGIRTKIGEIRAEEEKIGKERETLLALTEDAGKKAEKYAALYQRFIAGQAGLLAAELGRTLEEKGEAQCPVCRAHLTGADRIRLALPEEDTPDKRTVDRAKAASDDSETARSAQETRIGAMWAAVGEKKKAALAEALRFLPDPPDGAGWDWDALVSPPENRADAILKSAVVRTEAAARALTAAKALLDERSRRRKTLESKEEERAKAEESASDLREKQAELETAARECDARIGEAKKALSHETAEEAGGELGELAGTQKKLEGRIRLHEEALNKIRVRHDTCTGSLKAREDSMDALRAESDAARAEMEEILRETGFADAEDVKTALEPIGKADGETWLAGEQRALTDHDYRKKHARERIDALRAQTAGKAFTDTGTLADEIRDREADRARVDGALSETDGLLRNHRDVLGKAESLVKSLASTDRAWNRLDPIAQLASGTSGEGGRLNFDRYAMGTVFREILDMANGRMAVMSGGRYELVHKVSADRKNAKAGLDIEVLDNLTGQLRPSGTLSGGESFFTSLALALGLSDTVQNHAGGRKMETLFIDEGFGTLSDDVLDKALAVLDGLTEGNRLVGIISHVDRLDESISQKIRVKNGDRGSTLTLERG